MLQEFGDNSDNKPTNFPLRKVLKRSFSKPLSSRLNERSLVLNSMNLKESTSKTTPFFKLNLNNFTQTSKDFMVNYSFKAIPSDK